MPRKALDSDYIMFMVMTVCHELGKTEQEVLSWHMDDVIRWMAFFRLKSRIEQKAIDKARRRAGAGGSSAGPNSRVTTTIE